MVLWLIDFEEPLVVAGMFGRLFFVVHQRRFFQIASFCVSAPRKTTRRAKEFSQVLVPYCSGDLWLGRGTVTVL